MPNNSIDIVTKLLDPHYGALKATTMALRMEAAQIIENLRNIPNGWKLVPVEPTKQMMEAGLFQASHDADWADVYSSWKDMLAAAPMPPEQRIFNSCPAPASTT